ADVTNGGKGEVAGSVQNAPAAGGSGSNCGGSIVGGNFSSSILMLGLMILGLGIFKVRRI
ncbi:MAG: hypothetical protein QF645_04385, partial [Planctomycetota bacterium]|nr:hypothetical protein [Planctomycetota bacterium]